MPSYRLYRLDGAGKISAADWLEADADDDALLLARERAGDSRFEVWQRNRFVGSYPSDRDD